MSRLALFLLALLSATVYGQEAKPFPKAPTASPEAQAPQGQILDNRVDQLLREWSQQTGNIRSLYTEFNRIINDPIWKKQEKAPGSARYSYPNRARLDIEGENAESYVLTGRGEIWEFKPPLKTIKVFRLPPDALQQEGIQDGPLPFLFGTKPERAKARYSLRILDETAEDVHILVYPKLNDDKQNFVKAELWLNRANRFLPKRLMFLEPNGTEVTFEFVKFWVDIEINPEDFVPKRIKDWEFHIEELRDRQAEQAPPVRR